MSLNRLVPDGICEREALVEGTVLIAVDRYHIACFVSMVLGTGTATEGLMGLCGLGILEGVSGTLKRDSMVNVKRKEQVETGTGYNVVEAFGSGVRAV